MIPFKLTGIEDGKQTIVSGDWRAVTKFMGRSFGEDDSRWSCQEIAGR
jgi:hypothetical protein